MEKATKFYSGLKIKQLLSIKKVSVSDLAEMIGKSRQNVYDILNREFVKPELTGVILNALNSSENELERMSEDLHKKPADGGAFGEETENRISDEIQHLRELFAKELEAKNQQIAKLQETISALVGKSKG